MWHGEGFRTIPVNPRTLLTGPMYPSRVCKKALYQLFHVRHRRGRKIISLAGKSSQKRLFNLLSSQLNENPFQNHSMICNCEESLKSFPLKDNCDGLDFISKANREEELLESFSLTVFLNTLLSAHPVFTDRTQGSRIRAERNADSPGALKTQVHTCFLQKPLRFFLSFQSNKRVSCY